MTDDKKNQESTKLVKETLERLANALMFDKKHYDDLLVENQTLNEKIKRLEAMLERCKDQRDWWIHEKYEGAETKDLTELIDRENKNLESILEGR